MRRGYLAVAIGSAAAFGTSGPFSKALLDAGWTAGGIVLLRVSVAALLLLLPALRAARGRWAVVRANAVPIAVFGVAGVIGVQVAYVHAVAHLSVGVALLLEYLAIVLVALWAWLWSGRAPSRLVWGGMAAALGGLVLVLDLTGSSTPPLVGVLWGLLAALGLAAYFVTAADANGLPALVFATSGLVVGALALAALGLVGAVPIGISSAPVLVGGIELPVVLAVAELGVLAAALAYLLGTVAARGLGSTVASFVGLTEVLFAVLFAWLLLGELPAPLQLLGGVLIVGGVVAVRAGEASPPPSSTATRPERETQRLALR